MIKFGVVSDIHSEFWKQNDLNTVGVKIQNELKEADVILLAGDIGSGPQAIKIANYLWPDKPVCQVAGNHEYYNYVVDDTIYHMTSCAKAVGNVHFLNRNVYTNTDFETPFRVIGCTLWTDYDIQHTQQLSMLHAGKNISDYFLIFKSIQNDCIKPADVLQWHIKDKEWMQQELDKPFDGLTIALMHHCPVTFGDHPHFAGGANSPAFISNLDAMFTRDDLDLVVWGHTHYSVDRTYGNTRFVSNQVGYLNTNWSFLTQSTVQSTETGDYGIIVEL